MVGYKGTEIRKKTSQVSTLKAILFNLGWICSIKRSYIYLLLLSVLFHSAQVRYCTKTSTCGTIQYSFGEEQNCVLTSASKTFLFKAPFLLIISAYAKV